jgi:hypothetical protein
MHAMYTVIHADDVRNVCACKSTPQETETIRRMPVVYSFKWTAGLPADADVADSCGPLK